MNVKYLNTPFDLPCGVQLQNRIAKSAMSENMSPKHHGPTKELIHAYQRWVDGGSGLLITGNIMVDSKAIGEPGNVIVEDKTNFEMLQQWASIVKGTGTHLWPQLNHPGRQAIGFINREVVAPSAVKTNLKGMSAMFKEPRALTEAEILDIIERFGNTALILKEAGFNGVQIHGAHGYLVSQFLSPLVNHRKDQWGGSLKNRSRFVLEIYRNIRKKVGDDYPIGIKINSADFQRGGFTEEESMEVVTLLGAEGMDLIEVSGGSYESPAMIGASQKKSTQDREAYFLDYIKKVRKLLKTPLMLTGGFRTVATMERAIAEGELDIIGIARPFALYPDFPNRIFEGSLHQLEIPSPKTGVKMLDSTGFLDIKWYEIHIHRLGEGKTPNPQLSPYSAIRHNLAETMKMMILKLPGFKKSTKRGDYS